MMIVKNVGRNSFEAELFLSPADRQNSICGALLREWRDAGLLQTQTTLKTYVKYTLRRPPGLDPDRLAGQFHAFWQLLSVLSQGEMRFWWKNEEWSPIQVAPEVAAFFWAIWKNDGFQKLTGQLAQSLARRWIPYETGIQEDVVATSFNAKIPLFAYLPNKHGAGKVALVLGKTPVDAICIRALELRLRNIAGLVKPGRELEVALYGPFSDALEQEINEASTNQERLRG